MQPKQHQNSRLPIVDLIRNIYIRNILFAMSLSDVSRSHLFANKISNKISNDLNNRPKYTDYRVFLCCLNCQIQV